MITTEREKLRHAYINWLNELKLKYHITLVFPHNTPERQSRALLNKFIKHLNRKIYKQRYINYKNCLDGVAIREYVKEQKADHYHILIADGEWVPDRKRINRLTTLIGHYLRGDKTGKERKNHIRAIKVQDYYGPEKKRLEGYVMKQMEKRNFTYEVDDDFVGMLGYHNVDFRADTFYQLHQDEAGIDDIIKMMGVASTKKHTAINIAEL